jgi:outer membrane protein assembly factor BamB
MPSRTLSLLDAAQRMGSYRAIVCLDAENGDILWTANTIDGPEGPVHRDNSPATPTPVASDGRIYAVFSKGVVCCDSNGIVQWTNNDVTFQSFYGRAHLPPK